jgi:DNA/RNA endonuclease G (NUC1)
MNQKIRRPKVKVPSYVKVMAMLSPKRDGKTDRSYIKSMCVAIDGYNKHRNAALKKINKDTTDES